MKIKISNLIEKDKLLHLIGGSYLYLFFNLTLSDLISIILVAIVAVLIELVHDKWLGKGTPELMDVIYTVAGGVSVLLLTM